MPLSFETNFTARIVRLPLLSTTDESFTVNWRVRVSIQTTSLEKPTSPRQGPEDINVILDWTEAIPNMIYAPIGGELPFIVLRRFTNSDNTALNLWEPTANEPEQGAGVSP